MGRLSLPTSSSFPSIEDVAPARASPQRSVLLPPRAAAHRAHVDRPLLLPSRQPSEFMVQQLLTTARDRVSSLSPVKDGTTFTRGNWGRGRGRRRWSKEGERASFRTTSVHIVVHMAPEPVGGGEGTQHNRRPRRRPHSISHSLLLRRGRILPSFPSSASVRCSLLSSSPPSVASAGGPPLRSLPHSVKRPADRPTDRLTEWHWLAGPTNRSRRGADSVEGESGGGNSGGSGESGEATFRGGSGLAKRGGGGGGLSLSALCGLDGRHAKEREEEGARRRAMVSYVDYCLNLFEFHAPLVFHGQLKLVR